MADRRAVIDVPPVIGRGVDRINAKRIDGETPSDCRKDAIGLAAGAPMRIG